MKSFITIIFIFLTSLSFSQTESQRMEHAQFLVTKKNQQAYTTVVKSTDHTFSKGDFLRIKNQLLTKEGVFNVTLNQEKEIIEIYHLSYIEIETIKHFVLPVKSNVYFEEREAYSFK